MAALDPRTLQLIMAMEPAAQAKQAREMASYADVRAAATGGVDGAPGVALPPQPAMARGDMPEGNRLAAPPPSPAAGPMGGASTSPVRPAPDFAGVQPGLWSSGTAMPSGNRLTEIAPEQMPGGNMLGKEALPPELAGMQIGMAGPNEVAYGPPAGMQSAIATNDMPMQQPQAQGGGLFSGFGDDKRQFFADWLMGMGMGSTINESLAKGTQYALMSKKEREEAAKGEKQTAGLRKAAAAAGIPEELASSLAPEALNELVVEWQKSRYKANAEALKPGWRQVTDPAERAALGIPETDTAPYQVGPDNKLDRIGEGGVKVNISDQAAERRALAEQLGLQPGTPQFDSYVLTGRMLREDQQPLTATDKKAILEADEAVMQAEGVLPLIDRAIDLSKSAYEGPTAGWRGTAGAVFGLEGANETIELNNVVAEQALGQLKAIFGGAPTEGERAILLQIAGSANQPRAVREQIYNRAKLAVERRLKFFRERADSMRGNTFYTDKPTGTPTQNAPAGGEADMVYNPATGKLEPAR